MVAFVKEFEAVNTCSLLMMIFPRFPSLKPAETTSIDEPPSTLPLISFFLSTWA